MDHTDNLCLAYHAYITCRSIDDHDVVNNMTPRSRILHKMLYMVANTSSAYCQRNFSVHDRAVQDVDLEMHKVKSSQ